MVTEITNPTNRDVSFCVPNIAVLLGEKGNPPLTITAKAKSVTYSRSVTGNVDLEKYLTSNGCTLKRVRRNYVVIVAGQSNAVGYDESPHKPDDYKPVPFAYYEQLYPTARSGYGSAGQVPIRSPYADCFQNMKSATNSAGGIVKGPHRYIAEKLIGFVPEDYELEVWGYAYGGSGVKTGNAGTVSGANLPQNSTLWGDTGALSIATGKRIDLHFKTIQPQSKLMAIVWCLGEFDGQANVSVANYQDGFLRTMNKIASLVPSLKDANYLNPNYKIGTKDFEGKKKPLWIVYPGPQKYWNTKGTFKQIIQWQKENFSNFVDLPENLQTNDSNATGTKKESWRDWAGYGFTASNLASHYANCFDIIGHKVAKAIIANYTGVELPKEPEPEIVIPDPVTPPTPTTDEPTPNLKGSATNLAENSKVTIVATEPKETIQFTITQRTNPKQFDITPKDGFKIGQKVNGDGSSALNMIMTGYNFETNDKGYLIIRFNGGKNTCHLFKDNVCVKAKSITIEKIGKVEPTQPASDKSVHNLTGAGSRVNYESDVTIELVEPAEETWTFSLTNDPAKNTQLKVGNSNISNVTHTDSKSGANAKNFEVVEKPYNFITNAEGYLVVEYNQNKSSHLFKNGTLIKAKKITIAEKKAQPSGEVVTMQLFDKETFENVKFKLKDTSNATQTFGDQELTINGNGKPNRSVTPSGYYWDGSSTSPLTLVNKAFNFIIKEGYVKLVADGKEYFMYTSKQKNNNTKLKSTGIVKLS